MYYDKEMIETLSDVDPKKTVELSERPELYFPFEAIGAEKYIVPEK